MIVELSAYPAVFPTDALIEGIGTTIGWPTMGWLVLGVLIGIMVGVIPGIGSELGMAILLPLTVPLGGTDAIILLIGIYSGSLYGGSVAAILINTPGTAAAAATTFDGYPMARQGRALDALSISATASAVGGLFSMIVLVLISPVIIAAVLVVGSPEYFLIALLGLSLITIVAQGSVIKGIVAGMFGLLIASVGVPVMSPEPRYTFGMFSLYDGISFIVALIAMFAIAEMIKLAGESGGIAQEGAEMSGNVLSGAKDTLTKNRYTMIKSSLIGMFIGMVPGSGSSVSNFVSYGEAMRSEKEDPDSFGNGNPRGVIAAEAANNGTVAGSIVPTFAFGIPGSGSTAVLLGGILMHGLVPGPDLFTSELHVTYSVLIALILGNFLILAVGLLLVTRASLITQVDTTYIIPIVVILAALGSFGLRGGNWADVATLVVLGIIGYYMVKYNYSIIAFVLGVVLGPIAEENLARSLQISDGSLLIFVQRPLSLVIVICIIIIIFGPYIKYFRR